MTPPACDLLLLCAGRGERLRPLTDACPKPLLSLLGETLADLALRSCAAVALGRRTANAHHLPDQVERWAEARGLDAVQVEPVILDTGGALARAFLDGNLRAPNLLVHNGDILHGLDVAGAWAAHIASGADATLLVVDRSNIDTVCARDGAFAGVLGHPRGPSAPPPGATRGTFTGVAFYRTAVLEGYPAAPWSVKDLWHDLAARGGRVLVRAAPLATLWEDCGTPADLARTAAGRLREAGIDRWVDPAARVSPGAEIGPGCLVEAGARVAAGASLRETILLPGASVAAGERLERIIRNAGGDARR